MTDAIDVHPRSRLATPSHVLSRKAGGETVLLSLETEEYYGLDGVGSRFWDLLEGGTTYADAVAVLGAEYEVEQSVLDVDLRALLAELVASRLVTLDAA